MSHTDVNGVGRRAQARRKGAGALIALRAYASAAPAVKEGAGADSSLPSAILRPCRPPDTRVRRHARTGGDRTRAHDPDGGLHDGPRTDGPANPGCEWRLDRRLGLGAHRL